MHIHGRTREYTFDARGVESKVGMDEKDEKAIQEVYEAALEGEVDEDQSPEAIEKRRAERLELYKADAYKLREDYPRLMEIYDENPDSISPAIRKILAKPEAKARKEIELLCSITEGGAKPKSENYRKKRYRMTVEAEKVRGFCPGSKNRCYYPYRSEKRTYPALSPQEVHARDLAPSDRSKVC